MSAKVTMNHKESRLPRIETVKVDGSSTLRVRWKGQRTTSVIDLSGWIATGGDILAPLKEPGMFARAEVGGYGSAVEWDDGDLAIDAVHLKLLADAQRPFGNDQLREWQLLARISNAEAADLVGVSLSTWASYRVDAIIPKSVAIVCRASLRDPLWMQAYLRPRTAGRPRKTA
jgi:hypothetical protein